MFVYSNLKKHKPKKNYSSTLTIYLAYYMALCNNVIGNGKIVKKKEEK